MNELRQADEGVHAAVGGWISERQHLWKDWQAAGIKGDAFALVWESADLLALNSALAKFMTQQAVSVRAATVCTLACCFRLGSLLEQCTLAWWDLCRAGLQQLRGSKANKPHSMHH